MADNNKNPYIYNVDKNSDFEQFAWALENFDVKAAFKDFLNIENNIQKSDKENNTKIYDSLYKQFLDTKSSDHLSQLQLDVLNYILKYENGTYKVNDKIVDIETNNGEKTFTLYEPGFYKVEIKGPSGLQLKNSTNQFLSSGKNYVVYESNDKTTFFIINTKFEYIFQYAVSSNINVSCGVAEVNDTNVFLFEQHHDYNRPVHNFQQLIEVDKYFDKCDIYNVDKSTVFEYFSFIDDAFDKNFYCLKTNIVSQNTILSHAEATYNLTTYVCGLPEKERNKYLSGIQNGYYLDKISKNMNINSLKELTFSSFLKSGAVYNYNYLHGGDGGSVIAIIKLDKETTFQYNIGMSDEGSSTFLKSSNYSFYAECGLNANEKSFLKTPDHVANDSLCNLRLITDNNFRDDASKSTVDKVNFHIGENLDYNTYEAGCGRGFVIINNNCVFESYGAGEYGSGYRLNEFKNAVYQPPKNGSIKIEFLGSRYVLHKKVNFNSDSNIRNNLYICDEGLPIGCKFNFQSMITNSMYGCFKNTYDFLSENGRHFNYIGVSVDTKEIGDNVVLNFDNRLKYINIDKENKTTFTLQNNKNLFGTLTGLDGEELVLDTIMNGSFSFYNDLLYNYNKFCSHGLSVSISSFSSESFDLITSFKNFDNLNIFNNVESITQVEFSFENTLSFSSYNDIYGQVVLPEVDEAKIVKLEYSLYNYENPVLYEEGQKIIIPSNTKMFLKFTFNTSRIRLDESLTSFQGYKYFYKKNVDFDNKYIKDGYFETGGINFQCVEFIPQTSQYCGVFIQKNTYHFSISPDLFNELDLKNFYNRDEFEVGEAALIQLNIKNYVRISNLKNLYYGQPAKMKLGESFSGKDCPCYTYFDANNIFESFIRFGNLKDDKNFCDASVVDLLSRKGFHNVAVEDKKKDNYKGIDVLCSREVEENDYKGDTKNNPTLKITCTASAPKDESVFIYIYMKECDINLRLSANYNPGQTIACVENLNSAYVSLFKNYCFTIFGVGGPTGDGENGGFGEMDGTGNSMPGSFGGDGYNSGSGGNGGSTKNIDTGTDWWGGFVPVRINLYVAAAGFGGFPGRAFFSPGSKGSDGRCLLGNKYQYIFKLRETTSKRGGQKFMEIWNPGDKKVPYYTGIPIVVFTEIIKHKENFIKPVIYIKSGIKGLSHLTAEYQLDGLGGGPGLPSFLKIIHSNDVPFGTNNTELKLISKKTAYGAVYSYFYDNSDLSVSNEDEYSAGMSSKKLNYSHLTNVDSMIFEGGIAGQCHTRLPKRSSTNIRVWSWPDYKPGDDVDKFTSYAPFTYNYLSGYTASYSNNNQFVQDCKNNLRFTSSGSEDIKGFYTISKNYVRNRLTDYRLKELLGICANGNETETRTRASLVKFGFKGFDSEYYSLFRDGGRNFDNTFVFTNCSAAYGLTKDSQDDEITVAGNLMKSFNFVGESNVSTDSGIVKIQTFNDINIDTEKSKKIDLESFYAGKPDNHNSLIDAVTHSESLIDVLNPNFIPNQPLE